MAEGFKARLAVITAHTAVAHSAKGHMTGSKMQNSIVDTAASEGKGAKRP